MNWTKKVCRLQVYTGRQSGKERECNQGKHVVLQLTKGMKGTGRKVTADKFCSLHLSQKLSGKTLLGTLRKTRGNSHRTHQCERS